MTKKALIIGANGQDASYLADYLIELGNYEVYGTIRRSSTPEYQTTRINHLLEKKLVTLRYADLTDPISIESAVADIRPDEIYLLGAQSHVQISFDLPKYTLDTNGGGTLAVLEAVRRFSPDSRVYFAATSEMFGNNVDSDGFQRETTHLSPVSPYGCSKVYGHNLVQNYRNAYGLYLNSGILFNHESPRRGINFVTNKIANGAVKIYLGLQDKLVLGNLDAKRDWGYAPDFVRAMHMMLQMESPKDYVVATGETRSVRDFVELVFNKLDMTWQEHVVTDKKYLRPEELHYLCGDSTKIRTELGWKPTTSFDQMVDKMIEYWISKYK